MRDTVIARRALLAFVSSSAACGLGTAFGAVRNKSPGLRPPTKLPPRAIALDPGHGGIDPGAISPRGIYEKNITLATARELARQLDATGRYRAVLTRSGDVFVPLRERVNRARL